MNPPKTIKNVIKNKAKKIVKKTPTQTKQPIGIEKTYFKNKPVCKVTFRLPKIATQMAKNVCIVGDFNDWDADKYVKNPFGDSDNSVVIV